MVEVLCLSGDESARIVQGGEGGGGFARDVEPEQCRLDGTVFLGAIVVAVG